MNNKKTILAIILMLIVFLLWPVYLKKFAGYEDKNPDKSPTASSTESEEPADSPEKYPPDQNQGDNKNFSDHKKPQKQPIVTEVNADSVIIENNLFRGILSTKSGGTITSWKLKKYFYGEKKDSILVEMIPENASGNLAIVSENRTLNINNLDFSVVYDTTGPVKKYTFIHKFGGYKKFEKEFIVRPNSYLVDVNIHFFSIPPEDIGDNYKIKFQSGLRPTEELKMDIRFYKAYALQGEELLKTNDNDTGEKGGTTKWMAVRTKYFLMALITKDHSAEGARLAGEEIEKYYYRGENHKWKSFSTELIMPFEGLQDETVHFSLYMGPMKYELLKSLNCDMEKLMNFGWPIIKPFSIAFYHTLKFLNDKVLHNYGWAIIIFSILIKIVLYPLTRKSYKSMRAMQALQPKITALKEKYKKDSQKMNQETMKLYKREGVNPMGGCLPMILQMPVLFALFNLFRTTIMLRQASFLGGLIPDLSAPDGIIGGFNLLPILMGITMIIQQKLSNQDPKQKMMAYFMPLFLIFVFFKLSAGLNLYYFMFNLLTIAQELLIKKE